MQTPEFISFWITSGLYFLTFVAGLFHAFFPKKFWERSCLWSLWFGCLSHSVTFGLRWHYAQHWPVGNMYELNLFGSLVTMLILLIMQRLTKNHLIYVVALTSFIVAGTLLVGLLLDPSIKPLSAAYDSYWLFVHVFFAWFAFGCFTIATAFAGVYLAKARKPEFLPQFYTPAALDQFAYKLIALGVFFHLIMVVSGAIWAKNLWGAYWSWDALETWSLIVVIYYLIYLHARSFWQIKGTLAAWMLVLGLVILAISFWGLPLIVPNAHLQSPMDSLRPK